MSKDSNQFTAADIPRQLERMRSKYLHRRCTATDALLDDVRSMTKAIYDFTETIGEWLIEIDSPSEIECIDFSRGKSDFEHFVNAAEFIRTQAASLLNIAKQMNESDA